MVSSYDVWTMMSLERSCTISTEVCVVGTRSCTSIISSLHYLQMRMHLCEHVKLVKSDLKGSRSFMLFP
jgi:hypothetical protein